MKKILFKTMHNNAGTTYYQPREPMSYLFHHRNRTVFNSLPRIGNFRTVPTHPEWLVTMGIAIRELRSEKNYK